MLQIKTKSETPTALAIDLTGDVGPDANFAAQLTKTAPNIDVYCSGVSRINSMGVKGWIQFFGGLRTKGIKIRFFDLPTVLVEQTGMISNFVAPGEVQSLYVPYVCGDCGAESKRLFQVKDLTTANFNPPGGQCESCKGKAEFDDIREEYFGHFLRK